MGADCEETWAEPDWVSQSASVVEVRGWRGGKERGALGGLFRWGEGDMVAEAGGS